MGFTIGRSMGYELGHRIRGQSLDYTLTPSWVRIKKLPNF